MITPPILLAHQEPHSGAHGARSNWLRAAVLGANDGIVSISGLVVGIAGATDARGVIFTAGLAGIVAGAISMAAGEYVSVSSQRDIETALLAKERYELAKFPEAEFQELAAIYEKKGLKKETAQIVADELTKHDAFMAHVEAELGIDPNNLINPWHAAFASAGFFVAGAIIPLFAIMLPGAALRIPVTFAAVMLALALTGSLSAKASGTGILKPTLRVLAGGAIAMIVTYGIGKIFGGIGL